MPTDDSFQLCPMFRLSLVGIDHYQAAEAFFPPQLFIDLLAVTFKR